MSLEWCAHTDAVRVESAATDETLAWLCPDCDTQLPADKRCWADPDGRTLNPAPHHLRALESELNQIYEEHAGRGLPRSAARRWDEITREFDALRKRMRQQQPDQWKRTT